MANEYAIEHFWDEIINKDNKYYCPVCPYCAEELWFELGYISQHDMDLWDLFWYKVLPRGQFPDHHDAMEHYLNARE